jgi:hypothetical protein
MGMRRSRYVGLQKAQLQHVITAAAMNLLRAVAWQLGFHMPLLVTLPLPFSWPRRPKQRRSRNSPAVSNVCRSRLRDPGFISRRAASRSVGSPALRRFQTISRFAGAPPKHHPGDARELRQPPPHVRAGFRRPCRQPPARGADRTR